MSKVKSKKKKIIRIEKEIRNNYTSTEFIYTYINSIYIIWSKSEPFRVPQAALLTLYDDDDVGYIQ